MTTQITQDDLKKIEAGIRNKYIKVADNPGRIVSNTRPVGRALRLST